MIKFTNRDYPNFHVTIQDDNVLIAVTLNITPEMKSFLPIANVVKAHKRLVYICRATGKLNQMNEQKILSVANNLINQAMICCRQAKQKCIEKEIKQIEKQSPRIVSNTLFN